MACPVCQRTMQNLGVEGQRKFWCPSCGTLKTVSGDYENVESPRWTRLVSAHDFEELRRDVLAVAESALKACQESEPC
jgi:hypothetical protein